MCVTIFYRFAFRVSCWRVRVSPVMRNFIHHSKCALLREIARANNGISISTNRAKRIWKETEHKKRHQNSRSRCNCVSIILWNMVLYWNAVCCLTNDQYTDRMQYELICTSIHLSRKYNLPWFIFISLAFRHRNTVIGRANARSWANCSSFAQKNYDGSFSCCCFFFLLFFYLSETDWDL